MQVFHSIGKKKKKSFSAHAIYHGYRQMFCSVLHMAYLKCYSLNTSTAFKVTAP